MLRVEYNTRKPQPSFVTQGRERGRPKGWATGDLVDRSGSHAFAFAECFLDQLHGFLAPLTSSITSQHVATTDYHEVKRPIEND